MSLTVSHYGRLNHKGVLFMSDNKGLFSVCMKESKTQPEYLSLSALLTKLATASVGIDSCGC